MHRPANNNGRLHRGNRLRHRHTPKRKHNLQIRVRTKKGKRTARAFVKAMNRLYKNYLCNNLNITVIISNSL